MTVGSLFAGIGGVDLAAERAGFEVKWQVEIDDYATRVLEKHWPHVTRYRDIRTVHGPYVADAECAERWAQAEGRRDDGHGHNARRQEAASRVGKRRDDAICGNCLEPVDLVCGGFPCQPHSTAGRRLGAADERDLWPEFRRLIRELRPRWVVAENVPGLLSIDAGRFFGGLLRDLAALGFDAEWDCIPASAVGAPHRRDRVWVVAYPHGERGCGRSQLAYPEEFTIGARLRSDAPSGQRRRRSVNGRCTLADAPGERSQQATERQEPREPVFKLGRQTIAGCGHWLIEPNVGRVAHGVPARVDRLRGLGNAIVPQVAEWIFNRIKETEECINA